MNLGKLSIILLLVLAFVSAVTVFTPEEEGPDPIEVCETNIRHLKNRYMYAEVVDEYKALIKLIDDDKDQDAIHEMYDYIIGIDNYAADDELGTTDGSGKGSFQYKACTGIYGLSVCRGGCLCL